MVNSNKHDVTLIIKNYINKCKKKICVPNNIGQNLILVVQMMAIFTM